MHEYRDFKKKDSKDNRHDKVSDSMKKKENDLHTNTVK